MTVQKSINLTGSAPTIEAAVHEAIDRPTTTLEGDTRRVPAVAREVLTIARRRAAHTVELDCEVPRHGGGP